MSANGYGKSPAAEAGAGSYEQGGQDEVIDFLSCPQSYGLLSADGDAARDGPSAARVERIETHSAIVFLIADQVYKIKKSVKYPFLDFSTLDARHAACLNEVRVNQGWAPEIYLGVAPITRASGGGLAIGGGSGAAVEWLVRMRRFAQDDLYSAKAGRGDLSLDDIIRLAPVIRIGHDRADRVLTGDGSFRALARLLDESAASFEDDQALFCREEAQGLIARSRALLDSLRGLFRRRAFGGFVRRCHGDLHLGNIVQWRGTPTPFDAVEFDDAIATVDVLDDLAFLVMDLWRLGLESHANLLLNLYLGGERQLDALAGVEALPLFLAGRAMIRARAAAMRTHHLSRMAAGAGDRVRREASAAAAEAQAYFALAQRFLVPHTPRLVVLGGLSGSGKSTLARRLGVRLGPPPGALHLQSDVERKALFGLPPSARAPQDAYEPGVSEIVYRLLRKKAATGLDAGATVIVDAVHLLPSERAAIEAVARERGVAFTGLWLDAPKETLRQRAGERAMQRTHAGQRVFSDAGTEVLGMQLGLEPGPIDWKIIQAGRPLAELAGDCEMLL